MIQIWIFVCSLCLSLSLAALSSSPSLSLQIPNCHLSLRLCKFTERDKQSSTAMVAATKDSTAPSQPSAAPPEEDALKRNTDCVYFLASPLTCKKGSECEYRHSEHARMNPRDCWFWLNGNCLNPKCSFRHPVSILSSCWNYECLFLY